MSNQQEREQNYTKKSESTRRYDEVRLKMRKLVGAASAYIPDLCDALKQDWYPHLSTDEIRDNDEIREEMRDKILNDFSHELNEIGLWSTDYIILSMRDWLKEEWRLDKARKGGEARARIRAERFQLESQQQRPIIEKVIAQLPEPPKQVQPEPEEPTSVIVGGTAEPPEKYVPTPMEIYEGAIHGFDKAWQYMTNKDHIIPAGGAQDVFLTHIKTSRKLRLRMFKGLDKQRAIYFHNMLVSMELLIKDSLDMWDELKKEDTASKEIQQ